MRRAPEDRGLSTIIKNLVWGNWAMGSDRAMLLGPLGEVRDVLYRERESHSILAKREQMLATGDLRAVVYLRTVDPAELIQIAYVEIFTDGTRATHALAAARDNGGAWWSFSPEQVDKWIKYWTEGGEENSPPDASTT